MNEKTLNIVPTYNGFLPLFGGFIISLLITFLSVVIIYKSEMPCGAGLPISLFAIFTLWFILAVKEFRLRNCHIWKLMGFALIMLAIGLYMAYWTWHRGYLTNAPIVAINASTDGVCCDSMFHVTLAQAIKNYGIPSVLRGSTSFFNYHFGSHLMMALVSLTTNTHPYFCYCYLYPAIFFPLYVYLILSLSLELKLYRNDSPELGIADALLVMGFVVSVFFIPLGYLVQPRIVNIGNEDILSSKFVSESYLIAMVVAMVLFKIILVAHRKQYLKRRNIRFIILVFLIPFFLVLTALSKISVGFLLCTGITYYLFRNHLKDIRYYLINVFYLATFGLVYIYPNTIETDLTSITQIATVGIKFLSFMRECVHSNLWGLHLIGCYFFPLLFLLFRFVNNSSIRQSLARKDSVFDEVLVLICVLGAMPGMVLTFGRANLSNNFYFSTIQQLVATVFLIGFNIPSQIGSFFESRANKIGKFVVLFVALCLCYYPLRRSIHYAKILSHDIKYGAWAQEIVASDMGGYWHQLCQILAKVKGREKDCYMYIDASAKIWTRFSGIDSRWSKRAALYYYPAMTGIVIIGSLYYENDGIYYNSGELSSTPVRFVSQKFKSDNCKMTLDDAISKCRADKKQYLVYLYDDTFKIIDILQSTTRSE